jgi:hypothetical protein
MGRALLVLETPHDRRKAVDWIGRAPVGTRVEFKASKRSLPQNDRLWAMLTDIQSHMKALGQDFTTDQWKVIFMHAAGNEMTFLPTLDRKTFIPYGHSSSDLSKEEMTDLIEFIMAWGAENGIIFKDPKDNSNSGPPSPDAADVPPTSATEAGDSSPELPASDPSDDMRGQLIAFTAVIVGILKNNPLGYKQQLYQCEQTLADWKYAVPEAGHAKMDSISLGAEAVIRGKRSLTQFINYVATDLLDCTVGELGG